jgi:hypothetical protein
MFRRADHATPVYTQKLALNFANKCRSFSRYSSLAVSSGMLRPVALVRTDVSKECGALIIRVIRIGALRTTLAVTCNRRTLRRNTRYIPQRRFLQEPHYVITQKTPFFIVTAVKTPNLPQNFQCFEQVHCSTYQHPISYGRCT